MVVLYLQVEDLDLTPIVDSTEFPEVIHGTYIRHWAFIQKQASHLWC